VWVGSQPTSGWSTSHKDKCELDWNPHISKHRLSQPAVKTCFARPVFYKKKHGQFNHAQPVHVILLLFCTPCFDYFLHTQNLSLCLKTVITVTHDLVLTPKWDTTIWQMKLSTFMSNVTIWTTTSRLIYVMVSCPCSYS